MTTTSMRIKLTGDHRERILGSVKKFFREKLDLDLSDFQTDRIIDFFAVELGAPVYNQAIRDARGFIAEKLEDLDVEFYEPEEPYSG